MTRSDTARLHVLILGGTTQANALAAQLASDPRYAPVLSLAGRTKNPAIPDIPHRIGGFGGIYGLAAYLRDERIDALVDATHPFADQISSNAAAAARLTQTPLVVFTRPNWTPRPDEVWREYPNAQSAAQAIGAQPRRVLLTIGRLQLKAFEVAPQHDYLIRCIDLPDPPPALPHYRILRARGPFSLDDEISLVRDNNIEVLVSKNSGGDATRAKLDAARELGIDIVMIGRPKGTDAPSFETLAEIVDFLDRQSHRTAP